MPTLRKMSRSLLGLHAILALVLVACRAGADAGTSREGIPGKQPSYVPPFEGVLGPDLADQLSNLQLAIFIAIEADVADCMRVQGFEYVPRSASDIVAEQLAIDSQPMLNYAGNAIARLDTTEVSSPTDDSEGGGQAVGQGSDERASTWSRCFAKASAAHPNPLAVEGSWYDDAQVLAAAMTGSDRRTVAAEASLVDCVSRTGYGSLEEAYEHFAREVEGIQNDLAAGRLESDEALTALEALRTEETHASGLLEVCLEPYQAVVQSVFAEKVRGISEREAAKAALWAEEVAETVSEYAAELRTVDNLVKPAGQG